MILVRCALRGTGLSAEDFSRRAGFARGWASGVLSGVVRAAFGMTANALVRNLAGFAPLLAPYDAADDYMQLYYLQDVDGHRKLQALRSSGLSPIAGIVPDDRLEELLS